MKYASLNYSTSFNLGDQIQSLAMEQFLPSVDARFDRDFLKEAVASEKHVLIMQGWFSHFPERCFPPADSIIPVFYGFHITNWNNSWQHFLKEDILNYLKKHEPIGCRDRHTVQLLSNHGISAFYSKCLTITFPTRRKNPVNGKVFMVNVDEMLIPESIKSKAIRITHDVLPTWGEELKYQMAKKILKTYEEEAKLVITTKLHAALPCLAMGIPVIFFGNPDDYRTSIVADLGLPIYRLPERPVRNGFQNFLHSNTMIYRKLEYRKLLAECRKISLEVDWNPEPLNTESIKAEVISGLKQRMDKVLKLIS